MMSSHDIAEWWAEKTEPAQQRWVVDPVTLVKGWVDAVVTSLADAVAALQLTSQDMLLVRDPLAQGCTSAYYPDLCRYVLVGARHCCALSETVTVAVRTCCTLY